MTTSLVANGNGALAIDDKALLALVTDGDCARLSEAQKLAYYRARCEAAGLDYRAQPFQYVKLNNKLVLYALKAASDQLAAKHGLSVRLVETPADVQELAASGGCRAFTARVTGKDGRETDDVGVVTVNALKGDALANAVMKGATKAKRRAVLAHVGLGMPDETEIETIPRAQPIRGAIKDDVPALPAARETAEQIEGRLVADCGKGFRSWEAKRKWAEDHKAAKDSLPLEGQLRVSAAFVAAPPKNGKPKEPPHDPHTGEILEPPPEDDGSAALAEEMAAKDEAAS